LVSGVRVRNLVVVLGDQLDAAGAAFDGFDADLDAVLMSEAEEEATYIPQHSQRLVLFFSAMRHMREALEARGYTVFYGEIDDDANAGTLDGEVARRVKALRPSRLVVAEPGDYRVLRDLKACASSLSVDLEIRPDRHFIDTVSDFTEYAGGRKELVLEMYYRRMRKRHDVLMSDGAPVQGQWNFDPENRERLPAGGSPGLQPPIRFSPDRITREVIELVRHRFPDSPGDADAFDHPVTPADARRALGNFVANRLADFGRYQDAMASGEPYLYHSLLSSALNLHLLDPRDAIEAALSAYAAGAAPINSVEGFVRQILGWREYVRGVYWWRMPEYAELNALEADLSMPAFMWDADTEMNCVRQSVGQLVDHAYAHHIQRLMVLGLFSMLLGVRPHDVHRWHMSMYIDAVDWVSLPNVLGMSQYGDGGIVGSKPYCASGNYINRMGDYCKGCRYHPAKATGDEGCPITTLYWDFLSRNRKRLDGNRRMGFQFKNLDRKDGAERRAIKKRADELKTRFTSRTYL
jgi:deoxyribodipyrimidine photolyase-related protein